VAAAPFDGCRPRSKELEGVEEGNFAVVNGMVGVVVDRSGFVCDGIRPLNIKYLGER
jgi:hypothetical protein